MAGSQLSMRRPPRTRMQYGPTLIIDCSSPWGVLREGVFHKCANIYTPHPKTAPNQEILNRYFSSQETTQRLSTRMLYHVWLCSCHPCNTTLLFSSLSPTIQLEKNIWQVINYNFINTIKSELTFGKSSIRNQLSLSNKKENLTRYKLYLYWINKI